MDIWFFREGHDPAARTMPADARPTEIRAYAIGLEFVLKSRAKDDEIGSSNGIFYFDWIANQTDEGYWTTLKVHTAIEMVIMGSVKRPRFSRWCQLWLQFIILPLANERSFGLSMLFGAGAGVGVLLGEMTYWDGQTANSWPANDI